MGFQPKRPKAVAAPKQPAIFDTIPPVEPWAGEEIAMMAQRASVVAEVGRLTDLGSAALPPSMCGW